MVRSKRIAQLLPQEVEVASRFVSIGGLSNHGRLVGLSCYQRNATPKTGPCWIQSRPLFPCCVFSL